MRIKFICCDVFARLAYAAAAVSPNVVDLELLPMLAHTEPSALRDKIQSCISNTNSDIYALIVLGYGLCGNAATGLHAPVRMILPRMHDCCAMFIGSRARFIEAFGENLSMRWCACGYYERGGGADFNFSGDALNCKTNPEYLKLLEDYGEDNADYVWETLHPPIETKEAAYISINGFEYNDAQKKFAAHVAESGKELRIEEGCHVWFFRLVNGPWDDGEFLVCEPGERVTAVYDMEEVIRAGKSPHVSQINVP